MAEALRGKLCVVTGGNSGIGFAIAKGLLAEAADVVVVGRNDAAVEEACRKLGPNARPFRADVTSMGDLDDLYDSLRREGRDIDVLVANAGTAMFAPVDVATTGDYERLFDVNVKGAYFSVQKAVPLLNQGASVILVTSAINKLGMPGTSLYAATKAAVRSFARTLTAELAPRGIRVNALSPGHTVTPILGKIEMDDAMAAAMEADIRTNTPLGRPAQPEEIAAVAVFLATPQSSFVTGSEFIADGGYAQT